MLFDLCLNRVRGPSYVQESNFASGLIVVVSVVPEVQCAQALNRSRPLLSY